MRIAHNVIMDWYRQQRAQNIVDAPKENDLSNVGSRSWRVRARESWSTTRSWRT